MKVLAFDIFGDFGQFRKYYTTSSILTFSFPPPPTVKGMLGAISGSPKDKYLDEFKNTQVAIRIIHPIQKIWFSLNYINTKDNYFTLTRKNGHQPRTQIPAEFLKSPSFRIYVSDSDEILSKLTENIQQHKSFYTLSLGLSELLADYRFMGLFRSDLVENKETEIVTIVPLSIIADIKFEESKRYQKEKIPAEMDSERVVNRYEEVVYEVEGKAIKATLSQCILLENGEYIAFI
jgi:CRISPR-associated protein Cas5h